MSRLSRLGGLAARSFVLASAAAVWLPMPRYARSLESAEYIVWLARLIWVLVLIVGSAGVLGIGGLIARHLKRNARSSR